MGLPESSLNTITKPFSFFLSHCKVSCGSPCFSKLCGEDNRRICDIDTHEYDNDSDKEEQVETQ